MNFWSYISPYPPHLLHRLPPYSTVLVDPNVGAVVVPPPELPLQSRVRLLMLVLLLLLPLQGHGDALAMLGSFLVLLDLRKQKKKLRKTFKFWS